MNVATHQEKEKNEKTGKRKAGVKRRQADFKEAACYPSAIVQGAARRQNGLCEGCARGNWIPREGQAILTQPKWVGDRTTTLRRLLIGAVQFCSLYMYILYIRQKFHTSLSKKIGVNTCFEDKQKVRNDD